MTGPGRYATSDGSFAKSAGGAAARGGALIAVAVVIGFVLLWQGFDGGEATAAGDSAPAPESSDEGDAAAADETTTTAAGEDPDPTATTDTTDPDAATTTTAGGGEVTAPAEISVVVLNGTGEGGLATARGEALGALGYTWVAGNSATVPVTESKVYYAPGFEDEAKLVAEALSGTVGVLAPAPADPGTLGEAGDSATAAAESDIIVVLGTDGVLS